MRQVAVSELPNQSLAERISLADTKQNGLNTIKIGSDTDRILIDTRIREPVIRKVSKPSSSKNKKKKQNRKKIAVQSRIDDPSLNDEERIRLHYVKTKGKTNNRKGKKFKQNLICLVCRMTTKKISNMKDHIRRHLSIL